MKRLGIDIGSLYVKVVLLEGRAVKQRRYIEHEGSIADTIKGILKEDAFGIYDTLGITGHVDLEEISVLDPILSLVEGARFLIPQSKNVFAIGGETFSLLLFDDTGEYTEHSVNPPCASGTGSFLEQQAERLSISVAELAEKAASFEGKVPSIATRCAVFAKTDIIHAMQEGYSLEAICAGLSEGIARSIIDVLVKGRELSSPVGMIGGVSLNKKISASIARFTGKEVLTPNHSECAGAVGAAVLGKPVSAEFRKRLKEHPQQVLKSHAQARETRSHLTLNLSDYPDFSQYEIYHSEDVEVMLPKQKSRRAEQSSGIQAFLGIDIGSTSTKVVLLDEDAEFLGGLYTKTGGTPVKAVEKLLSRIRELTEETDKGPSLPRVSLAGAATTGSGRKMIKELFRADLHINEITAHAKAAVRLHPLVDTILEIGGQDSKFTRVRDGDVYFSTMNYVCAAGTGSFIEEQAARLDLGLTSFAEAAMRGEAPYTSDRCTVYMERDLGELVSEGWDKESLAAAVLHSVRDNYMAKVVNKTALGDYIVFQGATARNRALVAAFEQLLEKPIHVSPLCHLTGAFGAALLCREEWLGAQAAGGPGYPVEMSGSSFLWNFLSDRTTEEVCDRCVNRCLLTVFEKDGKKVGWGMKCGKDYDERSPVKVEPGAPEKRWVEIMAPLRGGRKNTDDDSAGRKRGSITIGIPISLYNVNYGPLWNRFLRELGFSVMESEGTTKALDYGKELVNSDFCAPMVLAHGYVRSLEKRGADFIFYPAIENENNRDQEVHTFKKKVTDRYFCYYSQYLPEVLNQLTTADLKDKLITPLLRFNSASGEEIVEELHRELTRFFPDITLEEVSHAFAEARDLFGKQKEEQRRTYYRLSRLAGPRGNGGTGSKPPPLQVAIAGRPYVMYDRMLHMDIPKKIEDRGVSVFWQEEFDPDSFTPRYGQKFLERMHWHYGREIIKLAEYIARTPHLFLVYLTCFRCSPDSFLLSYVKDIMDHYNKPYLVLQLDEHSSDIGYDTRIEAGLHSFRNYLKQQTAETEAVGEEATAAAEPSHTRNDLPALGDTVLIPYLDHLISGFWADCFTKAGYDTILLKGDDSSLNLGYRYTNGGECMPLVALIGGVIQTVKEKGLDPQKTFFYMPTVCMACNFPQFPVLSDLAFESAGLKGLKVGLINNMSPGEILGQALSMKMLESNIIGSILYKLFFRIKPYEVNPGETERCFFNAKEKISGGILKGSNLMELLKEITEEFRKIPRDESGGRKPRLAVIGDIYVKYNEVVNHRLQDMVDELGGELIIPSLTEYPFHFYDADIRLYGDNPRPFKLLKIIEGRYEKIVADLLQEQEEPDFAECVALMEKYGVKHYLAGETSISLGRALYFLEHSLVEAILHVNPIFCCPGVVTASIYRKLQRDFSVPIIDIFYDGTGNPNRVLIPHLHYLKKTGTTV